MGIYLSEFILREIDGVTHFALNRPIFVRIVQFFFPVFYISPLRKKGIK